MAARALLEIHRGDLERARERAREGIERAAAGEGNLLYNAELFWLAVRIETELAERARLHGDHEALAECERIARAALAVLDEAIVKLPGQIPPPESAAYRALAQAELTRLRGERPVEPWLAAVQQFQALGQLPAVGYADLRGAEALALAGAPRSDVASRLRAAHATALAFGSPSLLEDIHRLARRAGIALDGGADAIAAGPAPDLGLTDRELEVLRLLGDGRTNRQIGDELFITPKTASVHVSRILTKLGVTNRAEAAAAAHRMGLARQVAAD
jgi:DNA-binding CsgD family transcriptional regulator